MPNKTTNSQTDHGSINISIDGGSNATINGVNAALSSEAGNKPESINELDETAEPEYESIRLHDIYTSLFAEDNQLKTERIVITRQDHGKIEGYVELNELDTQGRAERTLTYTLKGVFAKNGCRTSHSSFFRKIFHRLNCLVSTLSGILI